ncbi:MAG: adenylyltransferase [Thermodesulfovibrio aggregans]|uniref:Adenylyltransferase n=1 Tax=Thermodesulfovibrio aggregans TaxID=86166 RepID=A0A2J6WMU5_9BACT|nr:MAG: adenylyltransferase [Thermodesulfovibrio aggregans]
MDFLRYNRQMLIDGWGQEGQKKLKNSTVFIAGAGGLGSPVSIYLAVAGVGKIIICDFDSVEITNLNRQILHSHTRIGINKALSAKITLSAINPDVEVIPVTEKITAENAHALVADSQIIIDCMDNLETRYILNEVAINKGIPLVFGAIYGAQGMLSFIQPPETPCLKCLFPEAPPKETFPVVGATPGVIGALQALEAIKYLVGIGKNLKNKLFVWDGMSQDFKTFKAQKDPACPVCGKINKAIQ